MNNEKKVEIIIPNYPTKILLSNSRRATYYTFESRKIPKKYRTDNFEFNNNGVLIDKRTKSPVIKNSKSIGTPKYISIGGNTLYSGIHERVRIKIMNEIKSSILPHLPKQPLSTYLNYPLKMKMEIYRPIGNAAWDIDNFNIFYFKAFLDLLSKEKLIPDDNIKYIINVSSEFYPIAREEDRYLKFIFTEHTNDNVRNHLTYKPKPEKYIYTKVIQSDSYEVVIDMNIQTGKAELIDNVFHIGIGKKYIIWNALNSAAITMANICMQHNKSITISRKMADNFSEDFKDIMFEHNVPVHIIDRNEPTEVKHLFIKTI